MFNLPSRPVPRASGTYRMCYQHLAIFSIKYITTALSTVVMMTTAITMAVQSPLVTAQNSEPPASNTIETPKLLNPITVISLRPDGQPSSLPDYIPTTIEGINAKQIAEKINATDAEDALKYFPSLLVRKRYIGDFDHAVLATRVSGTGNSARSLVYADGLLLSNLLGNGASFTPRWGLVSPGEIDRVDVLYGPFSVAYPGNSVGAVVDYVTRMPSHFELHAGMSGFTQHVRQYGTDACFSGQQQSVSVGNKNGGLQWWINFNHLKSDSQPIAFANKLLTQSLPLTSGVLVTGAISDRNPKNQDWLILGSTNAIDTVQDHAKIKLAYAMAPNIRASYIFGVWRNEVNRDSDTYLRDAAGAPVWSGNINVNGRQFSVLPTDFSVSRAVLTHIVQALSVKQSTRGAFDWEIAASRYDYQKDINRQALLAIPTGRDGGVGRITDLNGTGWNTFAIKSTWRPDVEKGHDASAHLIDFGLQHDHHQLRSLVSDTNNWLDGAAGNRFSAFQGETALTSAYVQDTWRFASTWRATIGLRAERWKASNGAVSEPIATVKLAARNETSTSPKLALAYLASSDWALKISLGRAVRNPTVAELYQGSISNNAIINNDPNLKPEKSWTSEFSAERDVGNIFNFSNVKTSGTWRSTLFFEDTRDALYSQTNVSVTPSITNIQNIDRICSHGVETALALNDLFINGFDLLGSITFAQSLIMKNDKFAASVNKWQPRVPRWRANLLATWRANSQLSTTLGIRYSGKQFNTLDNSDPNSFTYTGTSSFLVADMRVRYQFDKQWSMAMGIDNVNNQKYWNFHPYPQRTFLAEIKFDLN